MGIYDTYYSEFPQEIQNLNEKEWIEFGRIMDELDADLIKSIRSMGDFWDIERVPVWMLPFLSFAFSANIKSYDSERKQRIRIRDAIKEHQIKGTKEQIVRMIKDITGNEPIILVDEYSWFMVWNSINAKMPFPNVFMRCDSRLDLRGGGQMWDSLAAHANVAGAASARGHIFINLRSWSANPNYNVWPLSDEVIDRVIDVIKYAGTAYFKYYLEDLIPQGFKDGDGVWNDWDEDGKGRQRPPVGNWRYAVVNDDNTLNGVVKENN